MWFLRLSGLILALGGLVWLLFLSYALYTHSSTGVNILVDLGMPAALFGALAGGVAVGAGVWLGGFSHPIHRRPPAP